MLRALWIASLAGLLWLGLHGRALAQDDSDDSDEDELWGDIPLESPEEPTAESGRPANQAAARQPTPEPSIQEWFGDFELELRLFGRKPLSPAQPEWTNMAFAFRPGYVLKPAHWVTLRAKALVRLDESDSGRSTIDPREAIAQVYWGRWTATVGIHKVFWGVTESRHLVDVINQVDYREDLGGDERFGQLMAMFSHNAERLGLIDVFAMSWSRPQTYPAQEARPGLPFRVATDQTRYDSSLEQWHIGLAARWSMNVGELGWALSYFYGNAREPQLRPILIGTEMVFQPEYNLIHQGGLEAQWTRNSWLWKLEAIIRQGQGQVFAAATGGLEKTVSGIVGTSDLTFFLEYNYDGRDNETLTFFENDVFAAARLSLNDVSSTEATVAAQIDVVSGDTIGLVKISRRLREKWKASLEARWFRSGDPEDLLYWFRRDQHIEAVLRYYY